MTSVLDAVLLIVALVSLILAIYQKAKGEDWYWWAFLTLLYTTTAGV